MRFFRRLRRSLYHVSKEMKAMVTQAIPCSVPNLRCTQRVFILSGSKQVNFIIFRRRIMPEAVLLSRIVLRGGYVLFHISGGVFSISCLLSRSAYFITIIFFIRVKKGTALRILYFTCVSSHSLLIGMLMTT